MGKRSDAALKLKCGYYMNGLKQFFFKVYLEVESHEGIAKGKDVLFVFKGTSYFSVKLFISMQYSFSRKLLKINDQYMKYLIYLV